MSSTDFRQLAIKGEAGKAERLFRAAVSAFCCLTRPTRLEITQFEDLALPLFPMVTVDARRFAAAALSDCKYAPIALVRLLSNQPIDISAPLVMRSPVLKDIDLIALIGRHGLPHARVIARRENLNPVISSLVRALENPKLVRLPAPAMRSADAEGTDASGAPSPLPGATAENTRQRLRSMMVSSPLDKVETEKHHPVSTYASLRDAALSGDASNFSVALAQAIGMVRPPAFAATSSQTTLMALLRYLYLTEERAFLVMSAAFPGKFARVEIIRDFLEDYRRIDSARAETIVSQWKTQSASKPPQAPSSARLKAS